MNKWIWVDKLGVAEYILLAFTCLLTGSSVRYDANRVSSNASRLIAVLKRCGLSGNFIPAYLTMNRRDDQGYAINYHMERDLATCLDKLCERHVPAGPDRFRSAIRLYAASYLTYQCTFVTMVLSDIEYKASLRKSLIYLRRHQLNRCVVEYYRNKGIDIKESLFSLDWIAQSLKPIVRVMAILASRIDLRRHAGSDLDGKPAVWIEHVEVGWTDFAFWLDRSSEREFVVVKYIDRNDGLSVTRQMSGIERSGFKGIDLHYFALLRLARLRIKDVLDIVGAYFRSDYRSPAWLRAFSLDYRMWYLLYKRVFKKFNVKVVIQHQEALWVQEPQVSALEDSGGIMVGFHWSNMPYYRIALLGYPQHVMFVWGKMMHDWIRKRGELCRYVLPAGITLIPDRPEPVSMDLGGFAKFTIALFDSSVAYNIYQSEETLSQFYIRMLEMINKHPEWSCLIKSKDRREISDLASLSKGTSIVELAMSLKQQCRLSMLSNKVSPIECAGMADISVCYSLNTAGIISALKGHRAVHWDCSGWLNNPMLKDPDQKIVFNDLKEIEDALVKVSGGDGSYGDLSLWKDRISAFDDDLASRRVGGFISDFMKLSKEGGDVKENLDKAVNKYLAANRVGDDFYGRPNMWEDEVTGAI